MPEDKERKDYAREKREEGRRVHEGEARSEHDPEWERKDHPAFKHAARKAKSDVPPDAQGQAERGRIDQVNVGGRQPKPR